MTPLLPTDETPSAGARARAKKLFARFVYDDDDALGGEVTFSRSAMKQLRKDSALALDAYAKDHAREHLTELDCPLCHCCGEKRHDGGDPCVSCESTAREREAAVWKEAYEEFNYLVRSRSLWTPQFGEVLKKFHEARAGEERGTP